MSLLSVTVNDALVAPPSVRLIPNVVKKTTTKSCANEENLPLLTGTYTVGRARLRSGVGAIACFSYCGWCCFSPWPLRATS